MSNNWTINPGGSQTITVSPSITPATTTTTTTATGVWSGSSWPPGTALGGSTSGSLNVSGNMSLTTPSSVLSLQTDHGPIHIHPDGRVELPPGMDAPEGAAEFWAWVQSIATEAIRREAQREAYEAVKEFMDAEGGDISDYVRTFLPVAVAARFELDP